MLTDVNKLAGHHTVAAYREEVHECNEFIGPDRHVVWDWLLDWCASHDVELTIGSAIGRIPKGFWGHRDVKLYHIELKPIDVHVSHWSMHHVLMRAAISAARYERATCNASTDKL